MKITLAAALFVWFGFGQLPLISQKVPTNYDTEFDNLYLPGAVIACAYLNPLVKDLSALAETKCVGLDKSLAEAGAENLAFSHLSYFVQFGVVGNVYGYVRRPKTTLDQSGIPFEGMMFVTEPVPALKNKVVVIFSQISPERTLVFTLDGDLRPSMLYDSFAPSSGSKDSQLGSVYQVKVTSHTRLSLQERRIPGGDISELSNRVFDLPLKSGAVTLAPSSRYWVPRRRRGYPNKRGPLIR